MILPCITILIDTRQETTVTKDSLSISIFSLCKMKRTLKNMHYINELKIKIIIIIEN